jgi:hypothetical protein
MPDVRVVRHCQDGDRQAERFVVVLARKTPEGEAASAAPASKPAPLSLSVPDGLPFENDDAVIAHVLEKHLGLFFDVAEVEVEPPKGNFQVINKCGITGELLGPAELPPLQSDPPAASRRPDQGTFV